VAAKRAHVALRAGPFADINARQCRFQCECVALLNVLLFCHAEQIARLDSDEAIALVEAGESATNIVAVSPLRGPWFRTVHRGARSLNRPLVGAFGVTWQQAEQIRREWPGTRPMAEVDRALAAGIDEWTRDVVRALQAYRETMGTRIVRIFVAGGGCEQFGLLREWARSCDDGAPTTENRSAKQISATNSS
jgi:Tfp pilus assembly PilM family ATPase